MFLYIYKCNVTSNVFDVDTIEVVEKRTTLESVSKIFLKSSLDLISEEKENNCVILKYTSLEREDKKILTLFSEFIMKKIKLEKLNHSKRMADMLLSLSFMEEM